MIVFIRARPDKCDKHRIVKSDKFIRSYLESVSAYYNPCKLRFVSKKYRRLFINNVIFLATSKYQICRNLARIGLKRKFYS